MAVNFLTIAMIASLMLIREELMQEMWQKQQAGWLDYFSASTLTFFALSSVLCSEFPLFDGS